MPLPKRTFGESLSHFVRSIDIVDTATKDRLLGLIEDYLQDELGIKFFTFYVEGSIDQQVGLMPTDWYRGGDRASFSIRDAKGEYKGQVALAYEQDLLLWIVSPTKKLLRLSKTYLDLSLHAESEDIPKFVTRNDHEILTSIIRPIKDGSRVYGIVNFESVRYLEYSPLISKELLEISDSISTLFLLNKAYDSQRRNTEQEIEYLAKLNNNKEDRRRVAKPKVFIASSARAEDDVMSLILEVLHEYDEKIDVVYWREISESGMISKQILGEIKSCQYGVCYLSEPILTDPSQPSCEYSYQDNDNVLIEAGMLSTLSHEVDFDNWIPIREEDSAPLPFDFANNRTLMVPRLKTTKALKTKEFKLAFQKAFLVWLEASND